MTLAALEATLKCYLDEQTAIREIPTLNMMLASSEEIKKKAQLLKRKLSAAPKHFTFQIAEDYSMVGGGSMPEERLKTYVIKVKSSKLTAKEIEGALRNYETPIVARISNDEINLDLRTIFKEDFEIILNAFKAIGE